MWPNLLVVLLLLRCAWFGVRVGAIDVLQRRNAVLRMVKLRSGGHRGVQVCSLPAHSPYDPEVCLRSCYLCSPVDNRVQEVACGQTASCQWVAVAHVLVYGCARGRVMRNCALWLISRDASGSLHTLDTKRHGPSACRAPNTTATATSCLPRSKPSDALAC